MLYDYLVILEASQGKNIDLIKLQLQEDCDHVI